MKMSGVAPRSIRRRQMAGSLMAHCAGVAPWSRSRMSRSAPRSTSRSTIAGVRAMCSGDAPSRPRSLTQLGRSSISRRNSAASPRVGGGVRVNRQPPVPKLIKQIGHHWRTVGPTFLHPQLDVLAVQHPRTARLPARPSVHVGAGLHQHPHHLRHPHASWPPPAPARRNIPTARQCARATAGPRPAASAFRPSLHHAMRLGICTSQTRVQAGCHSRWRGLLSEISTCRAGRREV